jgi:hypothetical protein
MPLESSQLLAEELSLHCWHKKAASSPLAIRMQETCLCRLLCRMFTLSFFNSIHWTCPRSNPSFDSRLEQRTGKPNSSIDVEKPSSLAVCQLSTLVKFVERFREARSQPGPFGSRRDAIKQAKIRLQEIRNPNSSPSK